MRSIENRRIKLYRGAWYVVWREGGKTKRHSLYTKNRDVAERNYIEYLRQLERKIETVNDVIDAWMMEKSEMKSMDNVKQRIKPLRDFFGNLFPDQISRSVCRDYRAFRKVSDSTIRKEIGIIRSAINWICPNSKAVFELPPESAPRDIRITKDEYKELLNFAESEHIRLFIILAIGTAARSGALLDLTWSQIDFKKGLIQLSNASETNKRRALIPMTNTVRDALEDAYQSRTCAYVIEYGSNKIKSVRKGFKTTALRAGLPNVTPHVLRHTSASWMAEGGVSMDEISQYLGHSNSKVTQSVYARYSPDYLRKAASILDF